MSITERAKDMGVEDLVKENKRLENDLMQDMKEITKLEEENKNLKEEVKKWKMVADENGTHYDMLEEENKKLKKYYDRDKEELMESCYSLARENDELKKQIENLNGIAKMLI